MIVRASRRELLRFGSAAAAAAALPAPAIAQAWPSKPIKIICGYPAGGLTDTFGIDEAARDRTFFRKILDEEGPFVLEVVKSLNIEPQ